MNRVFLYEFVTGGGFFHLSSEPPSGSLLQEGQAMWQALLDDLTSVANMTVVSTRDVRLTKVISPATVTAVASAGEEEEVFLALGNQSDHSVLIAPEFDDHLSGKATRLEALGARLASPATEFIELVSDKSRLNNHLHEAGVSVPKGQRLDVGQSLPSSFDFPAVLKPNDGAGSIGVWKVTDASAAEDFGSVETTSRLEQLVSGRACSVGLLCGAGEPISLPPMWQSLSMDGAFTYMGGSRIMNQELCDRATRLAKNALHALPSTTGYVGVDLVLGECPHGDDDCVIEINPRLTTSYIGLRAIAKSNLAEAMLEIVAGRRCLPEFDDRRVAFDTQGTVRLAS